MKKKSLWKSGPYKRLILALLFLALFLLIITLEIWPLQTLDFGSPFPRVVLIDSRHRNAG